MPQGRLGGSGFRVYGAWGLCSRPRGVECYRPCLIRLCASCVNVTVDTQKA